MPLYSKQGQVENDASCNTPSLLVNATVVYLRSSAREKGNLFYFAYFLFHELPLAVISLRAQKCYSFKSEYILHII